MPVRSAGSKSSGIVTLGSCLLALAAVGAADDRIVKPSEGDWIQGGDVGIIAVAEQGRLLVDGVPLEFETPFPGILSARQSVEPGRHQLVLESSGGRVEVSFWTGDERPEGAGRPYVGHPPATIGCAHCHGMSRRGRFRFRGGCQSCHAEEAFIRVHSHPSHELASCGMCHDAHGSSEASLLVLPKEKACVQCHN